LTGTLHDLQLQLSPPLPSSLASVKPANPGSPGKMAVKMKREKQTHKTHSQNVLYLLYIIVRSEGMYLYSLLFLVCTYAI